MWIAYLAIIIFPLLLIGLVMFTIARAGMQVFRTGKRGYTEMKPYISDITEKGKRAQQMSTSFADRGARLSKSLDELGGRWAFISGVLTDTQHSPVVKMAGMAGRLSGGRDKGKDKG